MIAYRFYYSYCVVKDITKEGFSVSSIYRDEIEKQRKIKYDKYINGDIKMITDISTIKI